MRVKVLLFSSYAEAIGAGSVNLDVEPGTRVRDLLASVRSLAGDRSLPPALVAVNQEYATMDSIVKGDDEIAVIPPVAGG